HAAVPCRRPPLASARSRGLRRAPGDACPRARGRLARARDSAALHAERECSLESPPVAHLRLSPHVLDALETAQLDRGCRLRLPGSRQRNPFAALLATQSLSPYHRTHP